MKDLVHEKLYKLLKVRPTNSNQKRYWVQKSHTKEYDIKNYRDPRVYEIWEQLISDLKLESKLVYDYGCNNGVWSLEFLKRKAKVIGVDYIKPKRYEGKKLEICDITRHKPAKDAYLIHITRVLQHIEYRKQDQFFKNLENYKGYLLLVERCHNTGFNIYGRNWADTVEFFGFKVVKRVSDGLYEGILCKRK